MGSLELMVLTAVLSQVSFVQAQVFIVSDVYQHTRGSVVSSTQCASSQSVVGLVSTGGITATGTTNTQPTAFGSSFTFETKPDALFQITLPSLDACIAFCRGFVLCTAVQYETSCASGGLGICSYTTSTGALRLQWQGATATAACRSFGGTANDGSSVYVKYCTDVSKRTVVSSTATSTSTTTGGNTGTSTNTNSGTSTTIGTWKAWSPYSACIKISATSGETRTRTRDCTDSTCTCPTGGTCSTVDGIYKQTQIDSCTAVCPPDTLTTALNYCALGERIYIWNECSACSYYYCQYDVSISNWRVSPMFCPGGTRFVPATNKCDRAESDETCYRAPAVVLGNTCLKTEVWDNIINYLNEQSNLVETCPAGTVFSRRSCDCFPGPAIPVPKAKVVLVLCRGTRHNAGGNFGSAGPFPGGRVFEYATVGSTRANSICHLSGTSSNTQAAGMKVYTLSGMRVTLNPTFSIWFKGNNIQASNQVKQMLLTNRGPPSGLFVRSATPNIELYVEGDKVYFISSNIPNTVSQVPELIVRNDTWYCLGVSFNHGVTRRMDISSLTINIYAKAKGEVGTKLYFTTQASSSTVSLNREPLRVGFSEPEANRGSDYFTGDFDSFFFTKDILVTQATMDTICAFAPDEY